MKKTFLTNLILLVFLNLLIKPFWVFGIDRTVQNTVGASEYGVYVALFSLSIICNIFLDLGITNFNNRNIAQHSQLLRKYFSHIVVLKFMLAIVYAIITLSIGFLLHFDMQKFQILLFLIFNQFLLSFILYLRSNISGLHYYRTDSIVSVIDRTLMIAICGMLLLTRSHDFTIHWYVYAQTVSYTITAIIACIIVYKKTSFFRISFNYPFFVLILKQSYPFALLVLLTGIYTRTDMVMLEYMLPHGAEQAGIYAQSFRILDAMSMFSYLFASLLLPMFSKLYKERAIFTQLTQLSFVLLIVPTITFVIVTNRYSYELMNLMYHEHVQLSARIYSILIFSFIPVSSSYIFGTLLTAHNRLKELNLIALSGMALNIILNLIWIPKYGAIGAAWASVISQSIGAITQIIVAARYFAFTTHILLILKLLAFTSISLTISIFLKGKLNENWIYNLILLFIITIASAFALRLIKIKDLLHILKYDT